jgi:manganese/iron transport system substrate-binding protein
MLIRKRLLWLITGVTIAIIGLATAGCSSVPEAQETADSEGAPSDVDDAHENDAGSGPEMLSLPDLDPADLNGEQLQVVATTSIIGDVVAQAGGEAVDLTTLMAPGQDPHSYEPAARDLTAVAGADVIFVNGWDLEEGLISNLESIAGETPIVPISANIEPLVFGEAEGDHDHEADPHVWFSVPNVEQWVKNVEQVLSDLDPENAEVYASNAASYLLELEELQTYTESALADIPEERHFLVTNHNAFGYFADEYGFQVLGSVIPAASTLAEPSAKDLARLTEAMEEHGVCTLFTETAVSDTLAQTVAGELQGCETVGVVPVYTGATGPAGSGAESYIGMFHANVDAIVDALE